MLVPVPAAASTGPVLATLFGVNVGPSVTHVGSFATLLWRRVLRADDADVELGGFLRLGALAVPAALAAATVIANTSPVAISVASRPTPAVAAVPSAAAGPRRRLSARRARRQIVERDLTASPERECVQKGLDCVHRPFYRCAK